MFLSFQPAFNNAAEIARAESARVSKSLPARLLPM
ncbi:hypothetical protein NK6_7473 [Bradyrhizobium diazoefficiens]|jgi:hypothetical protein|uniref:Uncharacterized protein n=1 Tax=Bradyrhizobium diazoefficiens TaxID=1355477 RepID=A0A0E4FWX6_9BRAD|nr:hypothetical protein NK6_7473 [Bradyrhizobium diazoefficiens]